MTYSQKVFAASYIEELAQVNEALEYNLPSEERLKLEYEKLVLLVNQTDLEEELLQEKEEHAILAWKGACQGVAAALAVVMAVGILLRFV